jgi:hypothetical protein
VLPPEIEMSSGPNRLRKNSGWTIEKMTENGFRSTGRSSRTRTVMVSPTKPVMGRASRPVGLVVVGVGSVRVSRVLSTM